MILSTVYTIQYTPKIFLNTYTSKRGGGFFMDQKSNTKSKKGGDRKSTRPSLAGYFGAVVRKGMQQGWTNTQIAVRLGADAQTVAQYRKKLEKIDTIVLEGTKTNKSDANIALEITENTGIKCSATTVARIRSSFLNCNKQWGGSRPGAGRPIGAKSGTRKAVIKRFSGKISNQGFLDACRSGYACRPGEWDTIHLRWRTQEKWIVRSDFRINYGSSALRNIMIPPIGGNTISGGEFYGK